MILYWGADASIDFELLGSGGAPYTSDGVFLVVSRPDGGSPLLYMTEAGSEPGARDGMGQPNFDGLCSATFTRPVFNSIPPGDYTMLICGGGDFDSATIIQGPLALKVLPTALGGS